MVNPKWLDNQTKFLFRFKFTSISSPELTILRNLFLKVCVLITAFRCKTTFRILFGRI